MTIPAGWQHVDEAAAECTSAVGALRHQVGKAMAVDAQRQDEIADLRTQVGRAASILFEAVEADAPLLRASVVSALAVLGLALGDEGDES